MNVVDLNLGGGRLYQFSNRSGSQMMSFLIETPDNRLIMIDGGFYCSGDGEFLYSFLREKGGHISAWFITHPHKDHFGALLYMLEKGIDGLQIDCVYHDFIEDGSWYAAVDGERGSFAQMNKLKSELERYNIRVKNTYKNQIFDFTEIKIRVLNSPKDLEFCPSVNDSSICLKVSFPKRDVLFLGDIGLDVQDSLMESCGEHLRCDVVQMSHHGQSGAGEELYKFISPKVCLWCAPDWLWDNYGEGGKGTGNLKTLETREWIERLGVKENYVIAFGDFLFF